MTTATWHGFLPSRRVYTSLEVPGSDRFTYAVRRTSRETCLVCGCA